MMQIFDTTVGIGSVKLLLRQSLSSQQLGEWKKEESWGLVAYIFWKLQILSSSCSYSSETNA